MLRTPFRHFAVVLLVPVLFSCANAANHLRAQPAWFLEPARTLTVSLPPLEKSGEPVAFNRQPVAYASLDVTDAIPGSSEPEKIEVKCVRTPRSGSLAPTEATSIAQCLYMSIEMNSLMAVPVRNEAERNRLVHLLVNVSDYNCSTFLMRAFAHKAGTDATRNTTKDIAVAIAAGTAKVASGFSSGIGLFNLVGGTAIDSFNTSYYADKTFQVMAAAIGAERDKARTSIALHRKDGLAAYSFFEALEDVHAYDDACSLRRGLESLAAAASNQKQVTAGELRDARGEKPATPKQPAAVATADTDRPDEE